MPVHLDWKTKLAAAGQAVRMNIPKKLPGSTRPPAFPVGHMIHTRDMHNIRLNQEQEARQFDVFTIGEFRAEMNSMIWAGHIHATEQHEFNYDPNIPGGYMPFSAGYQVDTFFNVNAGGSVSIIRHKNRQQLKRIEVVLAAGTATLFTSNH